MAVFKNLKKEIEYEILWANELLQNVAFRYSFIVKVNNNWLLAKTLLKKFECRVEM